MEYIVTKSLEQACQELADRPATIVAGGTDVYVSFGNSAPFNRMIDISVLQELRGIWQQRDGIKIGALTPWSDIRDARLPAAFQGLTQAASEIGGRQIQNAGTIGGNICNASPAADCIPPLLTLDASVELSSCRGTRRLPVAEFVLGPRQTARENDEIVTSILIPAPWPDGKAAFLKLGARRYLVISIAMVGVVLSLNPKGRIAHARIAVGACSPVARRLPELEADLVGQAPSNLTIDSGHFRELAPIGDVRGTAEYRQDAVVELCRRAIACAGGSVG